MDLDDEELRATRKLNRADKESDIEKDIKRCKELIKPEHANWIGISNQLAIAHVVARIKELEENYIPKQKVKDKIKEIKEDKESKYFDRFLMTRDIDYAIEILEELLEDK